MAVTYHATGGAQTGTTSLTITGCTITTGDLVIWWVFHKDPTSPGLVSNGAPSGVSSAERLFGRASTSGYLEVCFGFANTTGTAGNLSVTGLTSSSVGSMASFSGVDTRQPFIWAGYNRYFSDANAEGTYAWVSTENMTANVTVDDLAVGIAAFDNDASCASWLFEASNSGTEIADGMTTSGTDCGGAWAYCDAAMSAFDTFSATVTEGGAGTANNVGIGLALRADMGTLSSASTLTDDFNDASVDTNKWTQFGGQESNGTYHYLASGYQGIYSKNALVLDAITVKCVTLPSTGTARLVFNPFNTTVVGQQYPGCYFSADGSLLGFKYYGTNGTVYDGGTAITYTETERAANPYWKLSTDATRVYWHTSSDGSNWTERGWVQRVNTWLDGSYLNAGYPFLYVYGTGSAFDDFNIAAAGGATVTPTVISRTASIPTPTVSAESGATVTAVEISRIVSTPAPASIIAGTGATVTATEISRVASTPAPTVVAGTGATATPTVISRTVSTPVATVEAGTGYTVTAIAISRTVDTPAPTVSAGADSTVTMVVVPATASTPTPTVSIITDAEIIAVVISSTASVGTSTVVASATVEATAIGLAASLDTPTVAASVTVETVVISLITTTDAVTVAAGATVEAIVVSLTAITPAPILVANAVVEAVVISVQISLSAPTIEAGASASIEATVVALVASMVASTVEAYTTVDATAASVLTSTPTPTVQSGIGAEVTTVVISGVSTAPTPTVSTEAGATITATEVLLATSLTTPTVEAGIGATIEAVVLSTTASTPAPTVVFGTGAAIEAVVISLTISTDSPTIEAGATVDAVAVSSTTAATTPTVEASATIEAVVLSLTVSTPAPTTEAGVGTEVSAVVISGITSTDVVTVQADTTVDAIVISRLVETPVPSVESGTAATVIATEVSLLTTSITPTVEAGVGVGLTATIIVPVVTLPTAEVAVIIPPLSVSFVANGGTAGVAQVGSTSITITGVTGCEVDDFLILWVKHKATSAVPDIPGWTRLNDTASATGNMGQFYRWVTAAGTQADVTVSGLTSSSVGSMAAFRGVDLTTPFRPSSAPLDYKEQANNEGVYEVSRTGAYWDIEEGDAVVGIVSYDNDGTTVPEYIYYGASSTVALSGSDEIADGTTQTGTDCSGEWWRYIVGSSSALIGVQTNGFSVVPTEGSTGTASNSMVLLVLKPPEGSATVTATTVSRAASVPTPTVAAQVNVSIIATEISRIASTPAVTVVAGTGVSVSAEVTSVVTSTPMPTAIVAGIGAAVTATVVPSTVNLSPASVAASIGISAVAVSRIVSLLTPTVSASTDVTIIATEIIPITSLPTAAASVRTDTEVTATLISSSVAAFLPTIVAPATISSSTILRVATLPVATILAGVSATITASVISRIAATPAPSVFVGTSTTALPQVIASTVQTDSPTVTAGGAALLTSIQTAANTYAPDVGSGATVSNISFTGVPSTPAPTLVAGTGVVVTPTDFSVITLVGDPAVEAPHRATPEVTSVLTTLVTPELVAESVAIEIQPAVIATILATPTPTIFASRMTEVFPAILFLEVVIRIPQTGWRPRPPALPVHSTIVKARRRIQGPWDGLIVQPRKGWIHNLDTGEWTPYPSD